MDELKAAAVCRWAGDAVRVVEPECLTSAVVFSSPHSGRRYPLDFVEQSRLSSLRLRASEDAFVDDLFASAPDYGAPLIAAEFPRAFLDANRATDELDPALIARFIGRRPRTLRVSAGLGVVPRIVAEGTPIYDGKLKLAEVEARIACCHAPYHRHLEAALMRARNEFGSALLIDCHSMPSESGRAGVRRAEIVIGDCYGASCGPDFADAAFALFQNAGFRVARNTPFAGGYITQRYGRPNSHRHAIQIEIDRGLYLDEVNIVPGSGYADLKAALIPVIAELTALPHSAGRALAAE